MESRNVPKHFPRHMRRRSPRRRLIGAKSWNIAHHFGANEEQSNDNDAYDR
jgi:hypothetical protein